MTTIKIPEEALLKTKLELAELQKHRYEVNAEESKALWRKINDIQEKSNCGTIKILDATANFLEKCARGLNILAEKVRHFTWKINAPCSINFGKSKKSPIVAGEIGRTPKEK